jgi:hypothetical protein
VPGHFGAELWIDIDEISVLKKMGNMPESILKNISRSCVFDKLIHNYERGKMIRFAEQI